MNDTSWLTPEVIEAVTGHMNGDHGADSLLIVRQLGSLPEAVSARCAGFDLHGMTFTATLPDGSEQDVVIPFSGPLGSRVDVRAEVVAMYEAAGGPPRTH